MALFDKIKDKVKAIVDTVVTGITSTIQALIAIINPPPPLSPLPQEPPPRARPPERRPTGYDRAIWLAVLDSKTCPTCTSRHGTVWEIPSGPERERSFVLSFPTPPAHRSCRCIIRLLTAESPLPEIQTGEEWLRNQPESVQREVLGVTKSKLFRDGGLRLDSIVEESGEELTIAELRERDLKAFREAGIE